MPGGKGVNVARALKTLGQPVIATGLAGGATGTRIIEQLTEEAILCDFVRIKDESRTSTAVIDPTSGVQTEINELGAGGDRGRDRRCSATSSSTSRRAPTSASSRAAIPRGVDDKIYAELITELKRLGVTTVIDAEGEPMEHGAAGRARPRVAELASRPRSSSATSSATTQDHVFAPLRALRAGPARGDHHPRGGLLRARRPRPRAPPVRAAHRPARAGLGDRRRRRVPGRLPRGALHGRPHGGGAALRRRLRRRVDACTSAPACSTRARPSASSTRSRSTELEKPRGRRRRA